MVHVSRWLLVTALLAFTGAADAANFQITSNNSGKCMSVYQGSGADNATVVQWSCVKTALDQTYSVVSLSASTFRLVAQHTQKCLEVQNNSSANGAAVVQMACNSSRSGQSFSRTALSNGAYTLKTSAGFCVDVYSGGSSDGLKIVQWGCNGGTNQQWKFNDVSGGATPTPTPSPTPVATPTPSPTPVIPVANLYQAFSNEIDSRIAGKSFGSAAVFNSQNGPAATYLRNPNVWSGGVDLTCFSPWNDWNKNLYSVTLISPIHVLTAKHVTYPVGTKVHFVTMNNQTVVRTIAANAQDPGSDIVVARLDSAVPSTIKPCRVMPSTSTLNAAGLTNFAGLPIIALRQEENLYVRDVVSLGSNINHKESTNAQRKVFTRDIIGGDSGNPMFFILNGELAFAGVHTDQTYGHFIGNRMSTVNNLMNQLGGGYQLQEIPLK